MNVSFVDSSAFTNCIRMHAFVKHKSLKRIDDTLLKRTCMHMLITGDQIRKQMKNSLDLPKLSRK